MAAQDSNDAEADKAILSQPFIASKLAKLGLNLDFDRAEGSRLEYVDDAGVRRSVVDCVGGYGCCLLGHNPPDLNQFVAEFLTSKQPVFVQASGNQQLEHLSRRLIESAWCVELSQSESRRFQCSFASTGAEGVEAAMKYAMLRTGSNRFITLKGGYHGKSIATGPLGNHHDQRFHFNDESKVTRIAPGDMAAFERAVSESGSFAGFLFEPIQGEGGVREVCGEWLRDVIKRCKSRGIVTIADECQTGMGRTGQFLAISGLKLEPDVVILSKALGGGLSKISASIFRQRDVDPELDLSLTSTFGGDRLSVAVATQVLELVDSEFLARVRSTGETLKRKLEGLKSQFPEVIREVRGVGLLLGIELRPQLNSVSLSLRTISSTQELLYVVASYLLNVHGVRIAPTLSDPWTFRIQFAGIPSEDDQAILLDGLRAVCEHLQRSEAAPLIAPLRDRLAAKGAASHTDYEEKSVEPVPFSPMVARNMERRRERRVAWICHMISSEDLVGHEPSFSKLSVPEQEELIRAMEMYAPPIVLQANDVESKTGERLSLYSILLSTTSHLMNRAQYEGSEAQCRRMVEAGVQAASHLGCESVTLGQYTSIVTRNGQRMNHLGMGVSTGNSYTVALAIEAVQQRLREQGRMPKFERLAVVGAAGNIGQTVAKMLAPQFESTTLIGSRRSRQRQRLERLAKSLANATVGDSLEDISRASVIVMAVSASEQLLDSTMLARGAILCDISVPSVTAPHLAEERPDVQLLKGGLAHLPHPIDLGIPSFPLPPGITFGCMAEGLILGFEKEHSTTFTGAVTREKVERIQQLARKHGFGLAGSKDFSVLDTALASGRG